MKLVDEAEIQVGAGNGMGRQMYGKAGEDLVITVPVGTVVTNVGTDEVIGDMTAHGDRLLVAKGGKGGLGNMHFKSSTNRTPRKALPGLPGEERELRLELKLLADVGLLGFPNAGKSTLIRAVSAATPKAPAWGRSSCATYSAPACCCTWSTSIRWPGAWKA